MAENQKLGEKSEPDAPKDATDKPAAAGGASAATAGSTATGASAASGSTARTGGPGASDQIRPKVIRTMEFPVRMRGYAVEEVTDYLTEVADAVEDLQAENQDLRAQNEQLRRQLDVSRRNAARAEKQLEAHAMPAPVASAGNLSDGAQASQILLQAQNLADRLVTDAQTEAHMLVAEAANVDSIDYVRTYAKVTHKQLESVVSELLKQIQLLGKLANQDNRATTWEAMKH
ncbi:DivIVA domain-containing protein [Granulicoccus phenolivorans]|uniref:DivIVA domain-containing protein n=1 Tax=Granulicoccus phenolivorans TaxID=266854 RepID=UPI00041E4E3E|nr:DivIVA domain-containing protein [Granulicoccus phenolivorans]